MVGVEISWRGLNMRFNSPAKAENDEWHKPWRRWFAWRPVRVGDKIVWLEYIEREGWYIYGDFGDSCWGWQYRLCQKSTS